MSETGGNYLAFVGQGGGFARGSSGRLGGTAVHKSSFVAVGVVAVGGGWAQASRQAK